MLKGLQPAELLFEMRRTISDGQASGSTVCHDTPHVLKVREGALRFALCGRLHVPSNEHTTMIHDARQLTGRRERSPDWDDNGQRIM